MTKLLAALLSLAISPVFGQGVWESEKFNNFVDIEDSKSLHTLQMANEYLNRWDSVFSIEDYNEVLYYYQSGCGGHQTTEGKLIRFNETEIQYVVRKKLAGYDSPVLRKLDKRKLTKELDHIVSLVGDYYKQDNTKLGNRCTTGVLLVKKRGEISGAIISPGGFHFFDKPSFPSKEWKDLMGFLLTNLDT